jgi:hypothetical protein
MASDDLSVELRDVLTDVREVADGLLTRLEAADLTPAQAVGMLESLAQIDRRRADVLSRYRTVAAEQLRRAEERSIRQYVLGALGNIGTPQAAGFLEDYLYAHELVEFRSRGVGALRRDEFSAWHSDRKKDRMRTAYIVPCLDEDGRKATRWMARSDWPLAQRLVVSGAEELWTTSRVVAMTRAYRDADEESGALFTERIDRYAREALGDDFVDQISARADRYDELEKAATEQIEVMRERVEASQEQTADRLTGLNEEQQLWGVGSS